MKNKLLVLLSLIMIVFSTSAFAKKVEKLPVERGSLYYEYLSPNLANGQYEIYYDNGQLEERKTFRDGELEGLGEIYYKNGQLSYKMTYKDGKLDGTSLGYYENGKLHMKATYKDGKREGLREIYFSDGTLASKCFYQNGKLYECE